MSKTKTEKTKTADPPLIGFADLGLRPELLQAVQDAGYTSPTPIQQQAIPVALMGRDLIGLAVARGAPAPSFPLRNASLRAASWVACCHSA